MTAALKRVFWIGLLSHVLAFSTMFLILSGLVPNGTDYIWCFLSTALVLAGSAYSITQTQRERMQNVLLFSGALVVLAGIGWLFLLRPQLTGYDFLLEASFAALGAVLLRRMTLMVADIKYIRQLLLEQYRNDLIAIVLFALLDLVFIAWTDPTWQRKMLPFFAGFLLTRMVALSLASQLTQKKNMRKSLMEKFQQRTPFFVTAAGLLLIWILSVTGGPIWRGVRSLLSALFGWLDHVLSQMATAVSMPEWLKALITQLMRWLNELICWLRGGHCDAPSSSMTAPPPPKKQYDLYPDHTVSWLWLKIAIVALIVGGLIFYLYRVLKRYSIARIPEGAVEIREFIQRVPTKANANTRMTNGALTPMRKTYRKFLLAMQKAGFVRRTGETASELVGKVASTAPHLHGELEELTDYYQRERYGNQSVEEQLPRAEQLARELSKRQEKEEK